MSVSARRLGPFDKPFPPPSLLDSSSKNCARLQNFPKHYNFARHSAAALPAHRIGDQGASRSWRGISYVSTQPRTKIGLEPGLGETTAAFVFRVLSLSPSHFAPGCDMVARRGVALATPQPLPRKQEESLAGRLF